MNQSGAGYHHLFPIGHCDDLSISIPVHSNGDSYTYVSLVAASVFVEITDLIESIYGELISEGETMLIDFPEEIDLSKSERYTFLTGIASVADTGRMCDGRELSFSISGTPSPPRIPTL
jgi:hypothetical protein